MVTLKTRIKPAATSHISKHQSGGVLLNILSGTYFAINPVGVVIWEDLQVARTPQGILQHLQQLWPAIDADDLKNDLLTFLEELTAKELVTVED